MNEGSKHTELAKYKMREAWKNKGKRARHVLSFKRKKYNQTIFCNRKGYCIDLDL